MIGWIRSSAGVLLGALAITACGPSGSGTTPEPRAPYSSSLTKL